MPYRYLDGITTADVAFEATGETLEEVFASAGDATVGAMVEDPESLADRASRRVELEDDDLELLLYRFLQEIVYYKDADELLLRPREVRIRREEGRWALSARLGGDGIAEARPGLLVDVKAVTLHRFELKQTDRGWVATVVLDV